MGNDWQAFADNAKTVEEKCSTSDQEKQLAGVMRIAYEALVTACKSTGGSISAIAVEQVKVPPRHRRAQRLPRRTSFDLGSDGSLCYPHFLSCSLGLLTWSQLSLRHGEFA